MIPPNYDSVLTGMVDLLERARRASTRAVNALMTATYWEIGRRIVEFEQSGEKRAVYGEGLLLRLSDDLTARFGRGFAKSNLFLMRKFYLSSPVILQTPSEESRGEKRSLPKFQTLSGKSSSDSPALAEVARAFPLPWSHYVLLISQSRSPEAMRFYHTEALHGGWSVRQLQRQIESQFYERSALSKNKAAMIHSRSDSRRFILGGLELMVAAVRPYGLLGSPRVQKV